MAYGGVPDRWREYRPVGTLIKNERIISFKTPLSVQYNSKDEEDNGIREHERFTPSDLIDIVPETTKGKFYLGMVIDLTNTKRYYDAGEFISQEVSYRKMKCVGHEIPAEHIVRRFKDEVVAFMENAEHNSVLGVHCTHGLNRTGYLVCRYLIDCRGYKPKKAIAAFNKARGYDMERANYLEDLRKRVPNRYEMGQVEGNNLNSYSNNYYQPQHDQTPFRWQRWNQPTQGYSIHYPYGSRESGNEYQFQRQDFPHTTRRSPHQDESYYNHNHHYQNNGYEGRRVGQRNRPAPFYRWHHKKPYSFKPKNKLQSGSLKFRS